MRLLPKAWLKHGLISDKNDTATAIGTYTGFQSAFIITAVVTALIIVYLLGFVTEGSSHLNESKVL